MSTQPQWYLIFSQEIPDEFRPLVPRENSETEELPSQIREGFEHELQPLGASYDAASIQVPEGTKFAGILYGDGQYFQECLGRRYGVLGELQRISSDELVLRDVNGDIILEIVMFDLDAPPLPAVLPPEAFGLQRAPWWKAELPWCKP